MCRIGLSHEKSGTFLVNQLIKMAFFLCRKISSDSGDLQETGQVSFSLFDSQLSDAEYSNQPTHQPTSSMCET